jgi:hypothetical protein
MAQKNVTAPRLPVATNQYDPVMINEMLNILRLYFNQLGSDGGIYASTQFNGASIVSALSFFPNPGASTPSLPTQADVANLRVGDIYYDTTANNVLKVKV